MSTVLPALAVAFAAFCVWLTVRIVNRRESRAIREVVRRKITTLAVLLFLIYSFGYAVARSRKFVVMQEYNIKGHALVVRHTAPGLDIRDDWRGRLKNRVNPLVFHFFRPLCAIEDFVRGGEMAIR